MHYTRIVLVGACYIDTVLTVPHFPEEDSKLRASTLVKRRGGNCPNTLDVLRQLLRKYNEQNRQRSWAAARLISVLPRKSSPDTAFVKKSFQFLVDDDFADCIYRQSSGDAASSYIIRSAQSNSRTIVNYNGLPEMTFEEFKHIADRIASTTTLFHFEGRIPDVIGECIRYLRQAYPRVQISLEAEKPARPGLAELVAEADMIFFSKLWANHAGYDDPQSFLRDTAAGAGRGATLIVTWGEAGSAVLAPNLSRDVVYRPALELDRPVIDTVGAGDTFIAGFLFTCICSSQNSLSQRLDFANKLAGSKIMQEGLSDLADTIDPSWVY